MIIIKNLLFIHIMFMYLFSFSIGVKSINSTYIVFLFLLIFMNIKEVRNSVFKIIKSLQLELLIIILLMIYTSVVLVINGSYDLSIIKALISFLIQIVFILPLLIVVGIKIFKVNIELSLVLSIILQAVFVLGMFLYSPFRELVYIVFPSNAENIFHSYFGIRGFGIASSVVWDLSIVFGILPFLSYMYMLKYKTFSIFKLIIIVLLSISCIFLTARAGLVIILLFLIFLIFSLISNVNSKKIFGFFLSFIITIFILFSIGIISYDSFNLIINKNFEILINYLDKGEAYSNSTNELINMYKIGFELKTFFFGDGYFINPNDDNLYYMNVDSGYLRLIYFFGIFGVFIIITNYFIRVNQIVLKGIDNKLKLTVVFIFITILIANIKGLTMISPVFLIKILYFYIILRIYCEKNSISYIK